MKKTFANQPNPTKNNIRPSNLLATHPAMNPINSSNSIVNSTSRSLFKACAFAILASAIAPAVQAASIVTELNSFSMGINSTAHLQNGTLIIHQPTEVAGLALLATMNSYVARGANSSVSWFDGVGNGSGAAINSVNAAATGPTPGDGTFTKALGVIINEYAGNPIYTTFHGKAVGQFDVLMAYTWTGDADLDGLITGSDTFLVGDNVDNGNTYTGWLNGDFDYQFDGVTGSDTFLQGNSVDFGGDVTPTNPPLVGDGGGKGASAVPEPGSLALLALGALGLLNRRSKRQAA